MCRGSSRTMGPPSTVVPGEAPFRRCAYILRGTQQIFVEDEWEQWELLAKRQLVRPSHQCRINITVFAQNPSDRRSATLENPATESEASQLPSSQESEATQESQTTNPHTQNLERTQTLNQDNTIEDNLSPAQQSDLTFHKQPESSGIYQDMNRSASWSGTKILAIRAQSA